MFVPCVLRLLEARLVQTSILTRAYRAERAIDNREVKTCWERGAWGIHSARAVPAQCPHSARDSARLENKAVPAVLSFLERKRKPLYPFKIKESRALLCFPGGHCRGHCAGTARALCIP